VRDRERGERRPSGDVRQVGADLAARAGAADRVTARARAAEEEPPAAGGERARRRGGRPTLPREPAVEGRGRIRYDVDAHVRVLQPAELRALAAIDAGRVGVELLDV